MCLCLLSLDESDSLGRNASLMVLGAIYPIDPPKVAWRDLDHLALRTILDLLCNYVAPYVIHAMYGRCPLILGEHSSYETFTRDFQFDPR